MTKQTRIRDAAKTDKKRDRRAHGWVKKIPASPMIFPSSLGDRCKYAIWRLYTPFHPVVRDTALTLGIVRHGDNFPQGRQPYVLGKLPPGMTIEAFVAQLVEKGFGNHFIAWKDRGQVVSLRYVENFEYQYHLRIFEDGEVRGHYEYTPECHPVLHMKPGNLQDRREEFFRLIGEDALVAA